MSAVAPDCKGCAFEAPELWESNEEAWELWQHAQTQWRSSGFGILGLDYTALQFVADRLGITIDRPLFYKIQRLEFFELDRARKKQQKAEEEEPAQCLL